MKRWKTGVVLISLGAGAASAGDGASSGRAGPPSNHRCAAYGQGYFAVKGSDACIRISGAVSADAVFAYGPGGANAGPAFNRAPSTGHDAGIGVAGDIRFETPLGPDRISIGVRRGAMRSWPLDDQ